MNNLKKQILSVAVATSTVLSCVPVSMAAIPADVQGTRYEEPVQILSALNIMVGDENGAYRLDDTIIRSEVAKMAIHALGLEDAAESSKGQTMFDDVSAEHWANGYINLAVSQGIIEGDGDGNFRPNAPISYAEAMTIMVRATGYTVSAEENGGYPHGYMKTGTSNGLAKNVQGSYSDKISRGNVAYLTTNALESKLMEQTGFGSDGKYEITEKTLLKDKLKVTKDTGRITAIENTSLTGSSSLAKGQIKIDNKTYETAYNMNNLLGYNVTYYVKNEGKNDESVILAMPIQNQNNDLTRLEALSLFARAMGSNDSANTELLEIAHDKFDSVIKEYGLKWGTDEIAYLMYKGALKKTDLDTYLKDDEKDTPMKRYEAAIIITKAMGGEEKALSELGVVLDYTDAREVPSNAIQYVSYATDAGIMEGMGEGLFSPNTAVKRSQMAVMLSRTVDKTNYTFEKNKITAVDTENKTITATNSKGKETQYTYTDSTVIKSLGDEIQASRLVSGVEAVFVKSGNTLVSVDTVSSEPDRTITGRFVNSSVKSGVVSIKIKPDDSEENETYECASNISVTYDGSPATVRSFADGDVVTVNLVNGKIASLAGESKTTTISGATIEDMEIGDDIKITISHGNDAYNGKTYAVSSDVVVKKNTSTVDLSSIYKGDKVTLTLKYGVITQINATSSTKVIEGTIQSLTIATKSIMVVKVDNKEQTYEIPSGVQILINGEEKTLYDFRVGDIVKLTVESDAITKIVATSTQESSGSMSGVVTGINTSYGVISVQPEGSTDSKQAFCKDGNTTFVTAAGIAKKMKDIKVGQKVEIKGTISGGVFIGKLVVIVSE